MRNFYNQPTNKIFDKMFGKGARQIQADPTLDLSKCKCCACDKPIYCKGCIEGHVLKYDIQNQKLIDDGQLKAGGCCHGPNNALIFEYERPGGVYGGEECCPPSPSNNFQGARRCCSINESPASNVKFYYNYVGQYFKMDYDATGRYNKIWPNNGMPRLCSKCHPSSCDAARPATFKGALETCLDFVPAPFVDPMDDQVPDPDAPCSTIGPQWAGCQCMGNGRLAISDKTQKRLSYHRKREMERSPYYRWLADIMCYDGGNVIANPSIEWYRPAPFAPPQERILSDNGSLYQHLVAVVHCEHWYELARCPENPEHSDGHCLGNGTQAGCVNTSLYAPRFWIYACSGVPLFDFEIKEAQEKGLLTEDLYLLLSEAIADNITPPQRVMQALANGGYLSVGDWRTEALSEIRELKTRKYTANAYGGLITGNPEIGACCVNNQNAQICLNQTSAEYCALTGGVFFPQSSCTPSPCNSCSTLNPLGPVRKKFWKDNIGVFGITGPGKLDPKKARPNIVSPPRGTIIEEVINATTDPSLTDLQLPSEYLIDPWNGSYPTLPPNPTPEQIEEYNDFVYWKDTQWLYMHARPGGWDYVCSAYTDPVQPDPDLRIPNLRRRFSTIEGGLGGCLNGLLGGPVNETQTSSGCPNNLGCGELDPNGVFQPYPLVGCGQGGVCQGLDCPEIPDPYCAYHPERGGKDSFCRTPILASNCNGIRFQYSTHRIWRAQNSSSSTGYQDIFLCNKQINAFLYRVNITNGNYDSFCPFTCRTLQIPKLIERNIPKLSMNIIGYGNACEQDLSNVVFPIGFNRPLLCPGRFCFQQCTTINPQTGLPQPCPGTYGGSIPAFIFQPSCCGKTGTGIVEIPLPTDWQHNASNRQLCPLYPGPGYPTLYDGQFLGIPVDFNSPVCCWGCNQDGSAPTSFGIRDEYECRSILIQNGYGWQVDENEGRGQIYTCTDSSCNSPGIQLQDYTRCNDLTPECACSTRTEWAAFGCPRFI